MHFDVRVLQIAYWYSLLQLLETVTLLPVLDNPNATTTLPCGGIWVVTGTKSWFGRE